MKLVNKKKKDFFFLSDLWQDHLINDFVEKLIEIKRMTTQVNKRFFLSDLWQDHLINDFVEKLIEIKRMTTQVN